MKKILLSFVMLFAAVSSQAAVGDDLTSKYLKNADFSAGTVMDNGICTYDYDMEKNSTVYFGQQAVEGWTAPTLSDNTLIDGRTDQLNARAAGLFGLSDPLADFNPFLGGGGYLAPEYASNGDATGQVLGLIAVWGAKLQYTQDVTLPAGAYTITIPTYNAGGTGTISSNLFGFIAEGGKAYTCTETSWGTIGEWADMTVTFYLEEETSGVISVGYTGPAGSGSMPHLFIDNVKIEEADAAPIIKAQVDALKESLLPLLEAGDELGVNTKDGWNVYNDDNATLEDVQKAIDAQKDINEKGMTDLTDFFINNAHFAQGSPVDCGVCTYDYDMPVNGVSRFGMQPVEKWTASSPSDNVQLMENSGSSPANPLNSRASGLFAVGSADSIWLGSKGDVVPATKANGSTEGNVFGFISVWSGTAYYSQHVTLPAGNYTITIPTYNERGTGTITKNMCGFIADSGEEYLAETKTFTVGKWTNETIKFSLDEETPGTINIGYVAANAGSGSMPHLFVDEFILKYNGLLDITPSLLALQGAVRTAENYTDGDFIYEAAIQKRLEEVAAAGQALINSGSTSDEDNIDAATAINNVLIEVNASVAEYEKFFNFLENDMAKAIEKYSEGELSELGESLSDKRDSYYDAYDGGEYTTAQIEEAISGLKTTIVNAVKEALESAAADGENHNLDISALFTNIDYAKSTVEGWQNETGTSAFLSRVQTAEVWNQSNFNVYQTLADMPAGAYEISTNGFYRSANNVNNYAEWEAEEVVGAAYLYAGGNKTLFHNVAEYAGEKDDNHTAGVDGDAETATLFVPNSNNNAHYIFYEEGEALNKVTTGLVEAGDLTIGVKGENLEGDAWAVWGAFTVIYKGAGEELILASLNEQIQDLIDQASEVAQDGIVASVDEAISKIDKAIEAGEDAQAASSVEEKTDAIAGLKAALSYAAECEPMMNKLMDAFNLYSTLLMDSEIESDDTTLETLLDDEISDPEDGAPSLEKIQEWIDAMPGAWIKFVCGQPEMKTASENSPVDVTAAIMNAGFEGALGDNAGASYWTRTRDGGNEGYEYGIYEFYNNNSFDIHQTLTGMTPGYYCVKVQSFYRAGSNANNVTAYVETPDSIPYVELYANEHATHVKNVLALEDIEESGYVAGEPFGVSGEVVVSYKGNENFTIANNRNSLQSYFEAGCYWNQLNCLVAEDGVLTLGLRKDAHVESDWCPYDNFELYYLGTTAPTAVESVKAADVATKAVYDLQGRKVSKAQKGLYIVNGKVTVVK